MQHKASLFSSNILRERCVALPRPIDPLPPHPLHHRTVSPTAPPPFAHHQVKPWNLCPKRTKSELVGEVKRSLSADKRTAAKENAFWVWHTIYNELDTDLTLAELVMIMTPDRRCNNV